MGGDLWGMLAKAFGESANENLNVIDLLGGGSQGNHIRQILMKGGVMERVHFGGQVGQRACRAGITWQIFISRPRTWTARL
ncbi:MAG: hypothetical protein U0X93_12370 [Anaerolineales bacterium]